MEIFILLALALCSYLLGSIPSAVWLGKRFAGIDVREHGSGNAGATNTFRVLGKKIGTSVLVLDILKGFVAVSLVHLMLHFGPEIAYKVEKFGIINLKILFGILAVVGHIFPVFAQFRGGKGIATLLGMVIGISYPLALCCIVVFLVVLVSTRYVSLSSMLATISYPILAHFVFHKTETALLVFGIIAAILVVITHKKNIKRLINGEESKANLFGKK